MSLPSPETMLAYASILEKPKYDDRGFKLATGEIVEAACAALRHCAGLSAFAQRAPMAADIALIIQDGWYAGRSSVEVAEQIMREFDSPAHNSPPLGLSPRNSGEGDPSVTPDLGGGETALTSTERAPSLPTIDQVRQTIADEWGSHLCYRDSFGTRSCSQGTSGLLACRCNDIAHAILSTYTVTSTECGGK